MKLQDLMQQMESAGTPIPTDSNKFFASLAEFNLEADTTEMVDIKEFLTSDDASVLLPRVVQGALREAAEPMMLFRQFFNIVRFNAGTSVEFPAVSAMVAGDIAEGQDYPKAIVDFALFKSIMIKVGKYGLMF